MKHIKPLLALVALCGAIAASNAQTMKHDGHAVPKSQGHTTAASDSTTEYKAGTDKMHRDMMIEYSGNADVDFARGMIPHHQGAIDMAKVQLRYGKDPAMRKLAQEVIAAQEKEIAFLRQWLKKQGAGNK
jgi:uncharacterized protein (DUF305 family)